MKKIFKFVIGGLQHKIYNLVLISMLLVAAAFFAVTVYHYRNLHRLVGETSERQQASIDQISSETLESLITETLETRTIQQARIANNSFRALKGEVTMLNRYARTLYAQPDAYPGQTVAQPNAKMDGLVIPQLLTGEGIDIMDPSIVKTVRLIGNMTDMMVTLYKSAEVNSCFVATPEGVCIVTDDRPSAKFDENGKRISLDVSTRPWYIGALKTGDMFFTDIEKDTFTDQIGIVCSMPVYVNGTFKAVVGADLFLDSIANAAGADESLGDGFVCIVNQDGHVVYSPQSEGVFRVALSDQAEDLRQSGAPELAQLVTDVLDGGTAVRLVNVGDKAYYIAGAPIKSMEWGIFTVIDKAVVEEPTGKMLRQYAVINNEALEAYNRSNTASQRMIIILLLAILAAATAAALILAKKIVDPLNHMARRVASISRDDIRFEMEDVYRTGDEIEVLASSFADITKKTTHYISEIQTITAEKERIGAELNMAKSIQESQLPSIFPAYPDRKEFDIYASMTPAKEVGGDFYDFFLIDDNHLGMVMADVSGKGIPAALFMMISRILIKNRVQSGESPGEALENVNRQIMESNETDMFVTVWLAVIEISTGKGIVANAGHEHPVLRRADGLFELVVYRHSPAVGMLEGMVFREHEFKLNPGDSLFVYTDGVTEASNSEEELFGTQRMLEALNGNPDAAPKEILGNVMTGIQAFVAGAEQFDDITMLCLKYTGRSENPA